MMQICNQIEKTKKRIIQDIRDKKIDDEYILTLVETVVMRDLVHTLVADLFEIIIGEIEDGR